MRKLTCQEVLDQLWEFLDEDARAELRKGIDLHLNGCNHCRVEVDSIRKTVMLYRSDGDKCVPIELSERLREALEVAYREHSPED